MRRGEDLPLGGRLSNRLESNFHVSIFFFVNLSMKLDFLEHMRDQNIHKGNK